MDHNPTYKYQVFNFIITHKLQEFMTPLTVYVRSEKAQNPAGRHFEKTNSIHPLPTEMQKRLLIYVGTHTGTNMCCPENKLNHKTHS